MSDPYEFQKGWRWKLFSKVIDWGEWVLILIFMTFLLLAALGEVFSNNEEECKKAGEALNTEWKYVNGKCYLKNWGEKK